MMASKARLFGDETALRRILLAKHPKQAKQEGRKVAGFDEATWVERRFDLVVAGNHAKFAQHPELAGFLLQTGQRVLVDGQSGGPHLGHRAGGGRRAGRRPGPLARLEFARLRTDGSAGKVAGAVIAR